MGKKSVTLLPKTGKILEHMGEQIRLAHMRRKISVALAAERTGVSRASVWAVEKGSAAVAIGIYAAVLHAISGMDTDLLKVAANDELGQKLHDIELQKKYHPEKRTPKSKRCCARWQPLDSKVSFQKRQDKLRRLGKNGL